jgi:hypothetical protein
MSNISERELAYTTKYNLHVEDQMFIVPVPFSVEDAKMLQHTKKIVARGKRQRWQQLNRYTPKL